MPGGTTSLDITTRAASVDCGPTNDVVLQVTVAAYAAECPYARSAHGWLTSPGPSRLSFG